MKTMPVTKEQYIESRVESRSAEHGRNMQRIKAYQARLAKSDQPEADCESIAYRAQQGLRWLSNRLLREKLRANQAKKLKAVESAVKQPSKKVATA